MTAIMSTGRGFQPSGANDSDTMEMISERNWKKILGSALQSNKDLQFFVSPEIPQKVFNNCIKSYAKYVTSQGDKIIALYDGGRNGKEGFTLTDRTIAFRDTYGNFGGFIYEEISSFSEEKGGDPAQSFPIITVQNETGESFTISFLENPQASGILTDILKQILRANKDNPPPANAKASDELPLGEQWREIIMSYLPHRPMEGLYKKPFIPEKLVSNAMESYGKRTADEPGGILALFEYKTSATEGFLLTENLIIFNMGYENWGTLSYHLIINAEYRVQKILNSDVPSIVITTKDGRTVELQFIINPRVSRYLFDVLEKGSLLNRTHKSPEEVPEQKGMRHLIDEFLPHDPANRIYKMPDVPDELLALFRGSFPDAFRDSAPAVIALYDNSLKGTGENGCVITEKAFHIRNNRKKAEVLSYDRLEHFEVDRGKHHSNINLTTDEGQVVSLSFYLFTKAQDEFMHFLRQVFPEREKAPPEGKPEVKPGPMKKYIFTSRRVVSGLAPKEVLIIPLLLCLVFFVIKTSSIVLYLTSMLFFFSLAILGLTLVAARKEYLKIFSFFRTLTVTPISEIDIREKKPVKVKGKVMESPFCLDERVFYREWMHDEPSAGRLRRILRYFSRELSWQSVPFYLDDGSGQMLVIIHNAVTSLYGRAGKSISSGDAISVGGFVIKNPCFRDYPEADLAISGVEGPGSMPVSVSDDESRIGTSQYEHRDAIIETAAGWFFFAAGTIGLLMLFFVKEISHQKGYELILNLFS